MILYKNNLCSLVWDGRTALDVRPFCVKICQLGLIFQFSILLELEGSLSLAERVAESIFLVLMSKWEMRHRGNFRFMKIELTHRLTTTAQFTCEHRTIRQNPSQSWVWDVCNRQTKPRSVGSFFTCCLHPSQCLYSSFSLSLLAIIFNIFVVFWRNVQAGSQE